MRVLPSEDRLAIKLSMARGRFIVQSDALYVGGCVHECLEHCRLYRVGQSRGRSWAAENTQLDVAQTSERHLGQKKSLASAHSAHICLAFRDRLEPAAVDVLGRCRIA